MNLAVCGTIAKNADDHVKSARIAKPAKDVRGVSSQASVSVRQPGLQPAENTRVVRRADRLGGGPGEGQTSPAGVDGQAAQIPLPHPLAPVAVTIGGTTVIPQYAGGAPGEVAGVMQINVQIPRGIQTVAHAATEAELRAVLEHEIGRVTYVRLIVDRERAGQNRGYGFVSFLNRGYFEAALADDGQITLRRRRLFISPANSSENRP